MLDLKQSSLKKKKKKRDRKGFNEKAKIFKPNEDNRMLNISLLLVYKGVECLQRGIVFQKLVLHAERQAEALPMLW